MSNNQISKFRKESKPALFIELAKPDELRLQLAQFQLTKFVGRYTSLQFGNGGDWIRKDGTLARHYNIRRHPEGRGKITHVELQGFRKVPVTEKPIPDSIGRTIRAQRCVVLGTSGPECDHKDGRLDDPR